MVKKKKKLSVEIPKQLDEEIREQVEDSSYANLSEFIRDSLRRRLEEIKEGG